MAPTPDEKTYAEIPFIEQPIAIGWARRDSFDRRNFHGRARAYGEEMSSLTYSGSTEYAKEELMKG